MNPNKILLSTRNTHKRQELEDLLYGLNIEVLTLDEAGINTVIEEDGDTFAENALKKAATIALQSGYITLADDSGLVVDALNGAPGIYSARFAGDHASDMDNNNKLLDLLQDIPSALRTARFICTIAIYTPQGIAATVEGRCEGRIGKAPRGKGGFGYDPLFMPDGYDKSFAELGAGIKNKISHRGKALQEAKKVLEGILAQH